jgi:hypothetical protein
MEAEALGLDVLRALRIFDYWIRQSDFATSPEDLFREVFYELHAQVPDVEDFGQMMKEWL